MSTLHGTGDEAVRTLGIRQFDFSILVGRKVVLFAEQFPGKALTSRVTVANGTSITVDRSGGEGLIDSLVSNQQVVLKLEYKGELISVAATLKRGESGGCRIILGDRVMVLSRRKFYRAPLVCPFRLAAVPSSRFSAASLADLRWIETVTINLSGGGTMIDSNSLLEPPTYVFANIPMTDLGFPSLLLGQVRHALAIALGRWHVGIQFVTRERRNEHLPIHTIRQMPVSVFALDETMQAEIEKRLIARTMETNLH